MPYTIQYWRLQYLVKAKIPPPAGASSGEGNRARGSGGGCEAAPERHGRQAGVVHSPVLSDGSRQLGGGGHPA